MKHQHIALPCGFHEEALIAVALSEAETTLRHAVDTHRRACQACQHVFERYQGLAQVFTRLQDTPAVEVSLHHARTRLAHRLAVPPGIHLYYQYVTSAVGELCVAISERGVALMAWRARADQLLATLKRQHGIDLHEAREEVQALLHDVQAYCAGTCERLTWPLDECLIGSAFQRDVLTVTAAIPYGAVMSYQSLAAALGQPRAVRAVAQALRRNPLALIVPCHRVVGQTGHLTGYAGGLDCKHALLTHEGIPLLTRSTGVFVNKAHMYVGWRTERAYCTPTCPSLGAMPPGEKLLVSPRAVTVLRDFAPCNVCHPETASALA